VSYDGIHRYLLQEIRKVIGPLVIGGAIAYLLVSIAVVHWAIRYARENGKSVRRWGWGAVLVMYLIPFWDWIPTVASHHFYCATESGFWIYKTLDQWKSENPGAMETLVENNRSPEGVSPDWPTEHRPDMNIAHINQRFGMVYKNHFSSREENELFLHVWRWKYELLDKTTGEILARQVDFSAGNGRIGGEPSIKLWLQSEHCISGTEWSREFSQFLKNFRGVRR
jgi:hypothetical protein